MSNRLAVGSGVLAALLVGGCAGGSGEGSASASSICPVVASARDRIMEPKDLTFEALVREERRTTSNAGVSAMLGLARDAGGRPLGPYEPVVDYLDTRNLAWNPEFRDDVAVPKRTDEVVESARRLDGDLADGLCDGQPDGGG